MLVLIGIILLIILLKNYQRPERRKIIIFILSIKPFRDRKYPFILNSG